MKKLLIVVDYQNDFVSGSLGFPEAEALEPKLHKKVQDYLDAKDDVVYTMDTHGENYLDTQEGKTSHPALPVWFRGLAAARSPTLSAGLLHLLRKEHLR